MGLYLGKEKVSNVASVITQNADSMATEIQNHIANSDIHITADEILVLQIHYSSKILTF